MREGKIDRERGRERVRLRRKRKEMEAKKEIGRKGESKESK